MWELVNKTPFAGERAFARDRDGAEVLVVVVKATFTIGEDGATRIADAQDPVRDAPLHEGDPATSPLIADADVYLDKPNTDVVLLGAAHAPRGRPTIALEVGMRVGPIEKRIAVVGDRIWERRLGVVAPGDPEPFTRMPIVYTRTYGGEDDGRTEPQNPCGVGFATSLERMIGKAAPNLVAPEALAATEGARPTSPRAFGPIARSWQPRLGFAGTFDDAWEATRMPLVPADYDPRHEQCAPLDQQVTGRLVGGEPVELDGLTKEGILRTTLPVLRPTMRARIRGEVVRRPLALHTVRIEPDEARMVLVYHVALPCHRTLYAIRRIVVEEGT